MAACTNAVVANWVVFVPKAAVGAAGVPVNVGEADSTVLPAPVDVVVPVPPRGTVSVPVVPFTIGRLVAFTSMADAGVPKAGVTSVGLLDNTLLPVPVEVVTPVPPFATGSVPVTPVAKGRPVALVKVPLEGVPSTPPLTTGAPALPTLTARAVATPVPRPEIPVETGSPVTLVIVPLAGVPRAGVVSVGLVRVLFVSVCVPDSVATVESIATVTAVEPL